VCVVVNVVDEPAFVIFVEFFQELFDSLKVSATDEVMKMKQVGACGGNIGS
jgi:hypothetical protein